MKNGIIKHMLGILLLVTLVGLVVFYRQTVSQPSSTIPGRLSGKLDQLWQIAQEALQDRKYLRAEKALLTILKVDERNASAYNRLGILYAQQKAFSEAIECFEIAQSLEPNASSLHNVGLIYLKTENYEKAALAFEQALEIDEDSAARHIAYAKAQEQLGHDKKMIESLEKAVALEPSAQTYNILADSYERLGEVEKANELREKSAKLILSSRNQKVKQPRRVVM